MPVSRSDLQSALAFLISIEPPPESISNMSEYNKLMARHHEAISDAKATIRAYGMQIAHRGLEFMQEELQLQLNEEEDAIAKSVIQATVTQVWDGCGKWRP